MTLREFVYLRCSLDEDCWVWRGAVDRDGLPVIKVDGKVIRVRRALMIYGGVDVTNKVCIARCSHAQCVNPEHVIAVTRAALRKRSRRPRSLNMAQRAKFAQVVRARSKITPEIAAQIRESAEPQTAVARVYGISQAAVSLIRRGLRWANISTGWMQLVRQKK